MNTQKKHKKSSAFLAGMGSILCLHPSTSHASRKSDTQALSSDWKAITSDFNGVFRTLNNELRKSKQSR